MKRKIFLIILILVFAGTGCIAGCNIYRILREYHTGEQTYDMAAQYVSPPGEETVPTEPEAVQPKETEEPAQAPETEPEADSESETEPEEAPTEPVPFPVVDFEALQEINPDVVAWITIEGTKIHYPVVQGTDNDHYLAWAFDGTENSAGSILIDHRNEPDFSDQNTVIYGHNMNNGTMFADISKFRTQSYYEEHPNILIMTPEGNYLYEIVAGYVSKKNGSAWQMSFSSDEIAHEWIQEAISKSYFVSGTVPEPGDHYLTLSTCSYEFKDARFVLVAVRRWP